MIRPEDFGPVGTSDDTAVVQSAINAGVAAQEPVCIEGMHFVSSITIQGANRFILTGGGVLKGIGPLPGKPQVLEVLNSVAVVIDGLNIDASYLPAYASAFKHWSNQPAGAFNVSDFRMNCQNAKLAMQFGDAAFPDLAISENTVRHGYFYGCAQGIRVIGSQAVLYVDHFQNITSPINWGSVERAGIIIEGGTVHVVGGSLQNAGDVGYSAIVNKAFASPAFADTYGRVELVGVSIETPGRIMRSENVPGAVSPGNGRLRMSQCGGYIGGDAQHLIELDAAFSGSIQIDGTNSFKGSVNRSKMNVLCGPGADVSVADGAFSGGMRVGADGVQGGVYRHGQKIVLDAKNTGGQPVLGGGWSILQYQQNDAPFQRFRNQFSNGVYTVPHGGHGLTTVSLVVPSTVPVAEISIRLNGNEVSNSRIAYAGQLVCMFPSLNAGDQISTHVFGISGPGAVAGGVKDKFQILAET